MMRRSTRAVRSPEQSAYLALTVMAICFGGTWVAGKVAVETLPPMTVAAARFTVAGIVLIGWVRLTGRPLAPVRVEDLPVIVGLALSGVAVYNVFFLIGLTLSPASDGAIIVPGMSPIFTVALAAILLGERMRPLALLGMGVAVGGLLLVVSPAAEGEPGRLLGDMLFVLAAVSWAAYSIVARGTAGRFDAVSATLYATAVGTLVLLPAAFAEDPMAAILVAPPVAWVSVLYIAVLGTVAAFLLHQFGLRQIGAGRANTFILLVPIVGVISSALLLREPLTWLTLLGGAVVLLGVWIVQRSSATLA